MILDRLLVGACVKFHIMTNLDGFKILEETGFLDYGEGISGFDLREIFEIDEIEYPAMKVDIDRQQLQELIVSDYIRNRLLNQGKYFKQTRDSYRVLLPSENAAQIISYMNSADNKLKRGLKLNKNTPPQYKISSNDEVRAIMKKESIKGAK